MAHFYNNNGELVDVIMGKNGKPRKTNIKDARELNLYPSVTELLKIFDKPAVTSWRINTAIEKAAQSPKIDSESMTEYVGRIRQDSEEKSDTAKDFGRDMHFLVECYLKKKEVEVHEYLRPFWPQVKQHLDINGFIGDSEIVVINREVGFAGTRDFKGAAYGLPKVLVDFKTQSTLEKSGSPKKINYYDEWSYQLGGYTLTDPCPCISTVISSDEPGRIEYYLWTDEEMTRARLLFKRLCEIYSLAKNLPYSWWSGADLELDIERAKGKNVGSLS